MLDLAEAISLAPGAALWLRLRVRSDGTETDAWLLEIPVPVIDAVAVHQRDAAGRWTSQIAGDTVPMRSWPQAGRYPFFKLQLRPGAATDILVEIRHSTRLVLPVRIVGGAIHHERAQLEYLGLGLVFGILSLLIAAAVLIAAATRDAAYGGYAVFATLSMLALAAFTGVASHLAWGNLPAWGDAAPGILTLLAGAAALQLVQRVSPVFTRSARLGRALDLGAGAGVVFAAAYPLLDRRDAMPLLALHIVAVTILCLHAAVVAWRRRDPAGTWMLFGALPLALGVPIATARAFGWLPGSWLTDYALVGALTLELPALLMALKSRSQERWSVELRRLASANMDPLTGVLRKEAFAAKLCQVVHRFRNRGEGAAVALIDVANYQHVLKEHGSEAAEEALLRAVVKVRRLVRDVDTTGRLGEHRFGLILEGVALRDPLASIGSRLIAAGLIAEPEHPEVPPLQFHVAATLVAEHAGPPSALLRSLEEVLQQMLPRTRRAFRYVDSSCSTVEETEEREFQDTVVSAPSADMGLPLPAPEVRVRRA